VNYRRLSFRCLCGSTASAVRRVVLTSDHQLALAWRCRACKKPVSVLLPLSECWRNCPAPRTAASAPASAEEEDRRFLRSVGIESL